MDFMHRDVRQFRNTRYTRRRKIYKTNKNPFDIYIPILIFKSHIVFTKEEVLLILDKTKVNL